MSNSTRLAAAFGILAGAIFAVSLGLTSTALGRLEFAPAVVARLASLQSGPAEMNADTRAAANALTRRLLPHVSVDADVKVVERTVPTPDGSAIPIRIYTPPGPGPFPLYLDLHGGGWWMGDGFPMNGQLAAFAKQTTAVVVSVDYRLAPEYPYPTPLDDCHAALVWMKANAASLGADPARIAVGGTSAGGNLAAALALRWRDEGKPALAFQYLLMPATDLSGTRTWYSFEEAGTGYVLTEKGIAQMVDQYVPDRRQRMEPYVSPLLEGDLSGLPPALIVTAVFDPLRDQGEAFAARLEASGIPVTHYREEGVLHGFLASPSRARSNQARAAKAVREALYPDRRLQAGAG